MAERFGKQRVSQMESAVGIDFRRGKQIVSRHFMPKELSVYSYDKLVKILILTKGVDYFDTLNHLSHDVDK